MGKNSQKRNFLIALLIVVILIATAIIFVVKPMFGSVVSTNLKTYEKIADRNGLLPNVSELGNNEGTKFRHFHKSVILFSSDAYILRVQYNDEDYMEHKSELELKYQYQLEPVEESTITTRFSIDTFDFRVVSFDNFELVYPNKILFVGMSDEKREIAYIYYEDMDLDHIDTSFEEFVKEECGW